MSDISELRSDLMDASKRFASLKARAEELQPKIYKYEQEKSSLEGQRDQILRDAQVGSVNELFLKASENLEKLKAQITEMTARVEQAEVIVKSIEEKRNANAQSADIE